MIEVTVIYAAPDKQIETVLSVEENCTVALAVERSKISQQFPEVVVGASSVGVNSRQTAWDAPLQDGDRVEIYRPLKIDPKDARRKKVS